MSQTPTLPPPDRKDADRPAEMSPHAYGGLLGSLLERLRQIQYLSVWVEMVPRPRLNPAAPLPLWMIFPVIFAALYLTHWSLLQLPYFWDEAGYYIPAAWDFFRTGSAIPLTTLTSGHPPLPSMYLALWWRVCGFHPEVTREAMLMVASTGLLAVWKLANRLHPHPLVAFWTVVLTALYPIWFAQSTLAHADLFAAAATLWALVYALPDDARKAGTRLWPAALWFTVAVLAKETAIVTPVALAGFELAAGFGKTRPIRRRSYGLAAAYSACLIPLAAWYVYHHAKTGYFFGNPDFLRYNGTANLDPVRFFAAFGHRLLHLFGHMNMFVPVLCTMAALVLDPVKNSRGEIPGWVSYPVRARIFAILLANAVAFSILGGALLTRYLLPMYPLVLLIAISTFQRRVRYWQLLAAFSGAAFVLALFVNPPYGFAPEDNLTYAHAIRLHQAAIRQLTARFPGSAVLTAWPVSDELTRPELGYVQTAWDVSRIDDFTAAQIDRAGKTPWEFSSALVFSTKENPPALPFPLNDPAREAKNYGLHQDLSPAEIARRLDGDLVWQASDGLQWVAVLRFHRAVEASLPKSHL